ncbi:MAG: hypothetical protein ABI550_07585 [Ignavibacteriaceae bacterium]
MGFLETLTGKSKVLSFEIIFDENNNVGVKVKKIVSKIPTPDYIRLWACYEAKMIYNLGYPNNLSAIMAIEALSKIVESNIKKNTDCFYEADLDDVIQFLPNITQGHIKFSGEFYAKGTLDRSIKTWLPIGGTEQQAVYSALALMQYSIAITSEDKECLEIFTKTVRNMIELYKSEMGKGVNSTVQVPKFAYLKAIGIVE